MTIFIVLYLSLLVAGAIITVGTLSTANKYIKQLPAFPTPKAKISDLALFLRIILVGALFTTSVILIAFGPRGY